MNLNEYSDKELEEGIERQVRNASVVVAPAGMYASHSKWIEKEIEIAKKYNKPIVVVRPHGGEKMPKVLTENADEIVGWRGDSIRDAVKRARDKK